MEAPATPGLGVDPEPGYAVLADRVARVGRWALAAVLVLAALGVFGGAGPLVATRASGADGFAVRYDRFARLDAPLEIAVTLPPGDSAFTLSGDLATDLDVEAVSPAPDAERATADGTRYAVDASDRVATVHGRPARFGVLGGAVRLDGGERLDLRVVVYP